MNDYHLGPDGTTICHYFEQLRLLAYPDPGSPMAKAARAGRPLHGLSGAPWTIGWGDTGPDVVPGLQITKEEADRRFADRMANEFEPGVRAALHVEVTQKQFDAMVSLAYNTGVQAFSDSTLCRLVNEGDITGATGQFKRWNKSGGVIMKGLNRRRYAEAWVFAGGSAGEGIDRALKVFP